MVFTQLAESGDAAQENCLGCGQTAQRHQEVQRVGRLGWAGRSTGRPARHLSFLCQGHRKARVQGTQQPAELRAEWPLKA